MDSQSVFAIVALIVAAITAWATYRQAKKTEDALTLQQRFSRANTVLHFTQSFFHLIEQNGRVTSEKLQDLDWSYKYWGLHSTEFYFYHIGVIPKLMYALWIVDVADLYASDEGCAWQSHEEFLNHYSVLYPEMKDFFSKINDISKTKSRDTRHRDVREYVLDWVDKHPGNHMH